MPQVWGLIDDRAGNASQVRGVVEHLGFEHSFKTIVYNPWVRLPNALSGIGLLGVNRAQSSALQPPWPDVVVAAGRRLAPVAAYIKQQHPQAFLVQLMSPGLPLGRFDVVALPSHDRVRNRQNVIRTLGAPHHVTHHKLKAAAQDFAPLFAHCHGYRFGVLVGGHTSHGHMRAEDIRRLWAQLEPVCGLSPLLITTSRRTPMEAITQLEEAVRQRPHYLYRYGQSQEENPYLGILGTADVLVVTGESISMCSEACFTGRPVYVFEPARALSEKHKRFLATLYSQGFARPLEQYDPDWRPANRLDEAERLAEIITTRLADRKH